MPNLWKAVQRHNYEPGDYLLINHKGEDVGVSGNTEFWDVETELRRVYPGQQGKYVIVRIVEVSP